jgi:hypothetical protein
MGEDRYARYGAATGIVFLVLMIVGFFVVFGSDPPSVDSEANVWSSWYADNENRIQTGLVILGFSLFFYIWFLGTLRSAIASVEPGGRLASIAFGGGIVTAGFLLVAITATATATFEAVEGGVDPNIVETIHEFGIAVAGPATAGFAALLAATSIAGYRYAVVPAPIAGLCALGAILQLPAYGVAVTETGVFAGDGALGFVAPLLGFVVPIAAVSITLMRHPAAATAQ